VLRPPVDSAQYTSGQFGEALDAHGVLASVGSTGDAYDNAMAESFVDTFKTELIADRAWRSRSQLELAIVEWVGWYNGRRLHEALGDIPPVEFELEYALAAAPSAPSAPDGRRSTVALRAPAPRPPSDHRTTVPNAT
jgi:putative transposase